MKKIHLKVHMVNGDSHDVETILADQILYSTTRQKHKWPTMQEDPILFAAFLAFAAMQRQGQFTGNWDDFQQQVSMIDEDSMEDIEPF